MGTPSQPIARGGPHHRSALRARQCDGLTLLTGKGQFRESDEKIVQETSLVLVLLYPLDARTESNVKFVKKSRARECSRRILRSTIVIGRSSQPMIRVVCGGR